MATYEVLRGRLFAPGPPGCGCERCSFDRQVLEARKVKEPTPAQKLLRLKGTKGHLYSSEKGSNVVVTDLDLISMFGGLRFKEMPRRTSTSEGSRKPVSTEARPPRAPKKEDSAKAD